MPIDKCKVKIVDNKVVCDTKQTTSGSGNDTADLMIKNKQKMKHLIGIGMDLNKYHPTILRTMIDGGRNSEKIPDQLKPQLIHFANEAHEKGFNPSLYGYNTTLHKFIKSVHKIPKRPYIKKHVKFEGKGNVPNIKLEVKEVSSESSSESSRESETDLDGVLSDVEADIKGGNISAGKKKLKQYKHRIPKGFYNKIMGSIQ